MTEYLVSLSYHTEDDRIMIEVAAMIENGEIMARSTPIDSQTMRIYCTQFQDLVKVLKAVHVD